jgi:hypothetical protein
MLGYMKAGLTEDELYEFQVKQHAQMVSGLMEKYGVKRYTIVRALIYELPRIARDEFTSLFGAKITSSL